MHSKLQDGRKGAVMAILHAKELIVWEMHHRPS
jgi:hypothetical protein